MSESHDSLPEFAKAESIRFGRILVAMTIMVGVVSLPAVVVVLAFVPAASGYLVVAMASLVLITTGAWDGTAPDADSTVGYETGREATFVLALVYLLLAGTFSSLLVVSAGSGHLVAQAGFPTLGLVTAAGLAFLDHRGARIDDRLSIVNLSGTVMEWLLRGLSIIYGLPASLGEDVREQRRNVY